MRQPPRTNLQPVNEPIATDVDSGITAIHHTLGFSPFQASPGSHRHDGSDSHRIKLSDAQHEDISYQPLGGTDGTQPTFSGDPLITGSYVKLGSLCHFQIEVDFDNITSFGSGQYYLTLPFNSEHQFFVSGGFLFDASGNDFYTMSGRCDAGDNVLHLYSVASNGRVVPFTYSVPVTLDVADNFVVSGTYHVEP